MAPRVALPGELLLDAVVVYPTRRLFGAGTDANEADWARPVDYDKATKDRAERRGPYVALRWVLNPALGIPLEPFTVWRRPVSKREPAQPIALHQSGFDTWVWDGVTEMLVIELDLTGAVTAQGLARADLDPVVTVSGTAGDTIVLAGGPMLGLRLEGPGGVSAVRGLSTNVMANGADWTPFERVGLPFAPEIDAGYYRVNPQGPTVAPTDAVTAAVDRIARWGPPVGWQPLSGLDPWRPPDPGRLIAELQPDVLQDLATVLAANEPPAVGGQLTAEVKHPLGELRQIVGARVRPLNGGAARDRSTVTVRPLQAVTTAAATDTWASLALGFGTGDSLGGDGGREACDYMVTAPWDGYVTVPVSVEGPGPWFPSTVQFVQEEVERELVAIVLDPDVREPPDAPAPVDVEVAFDEGAPAIDEQYRAGVLLRAPRTTSVPGSPRASGYALARFDGSGSGRYELREHPLAKGWIPIGAAEPVRNLDDPPDPALVPGTVMLRDNGVERPLLGPPLAYQYAVAANDLFGQWSSWTPAWLSLPPAGVQAPVVSGVRVHADPGAGGEDPCPLQVTADVVWNMRERSCSQLHVSVDVFVPTPDPPDPYDDPPDTPQGGAVTIADVLLPLANDGTPGAAPAGVTISQRDDDDVPVTAAALVGSDDRRYRIEFTDLAVTYGGAPELAVAVYAQAEETVRPGEWSDWSHTREVAIAPNPLPPPAPASLPADYPEWASLPDATGISYAPVTWAPTGAWRYRVYEATEAALLSACGEPGPILTTGYSERMRALHDLYKDPANHEKLKSAYRKLGTDPILPPTQAGEMRFDSVLPRGSALIHCYVVAAVSAANVISAWPEPDGDGRGAFLAYTIPHRLQPARPEISARLGPDGHPVVTVRVDGAVPAIALELYRAANAILARQPGTMERIATITTTPASWQMTTIADPAAPQSWGRLQYRAVALTANDPERAQMAVPSEPSRSYALLNPPAGPPALALAANVTGSTATLSVVRVDTDALRNGSDIGDFLLATTASAAGQPPAFSSIPLSEVPTFASVGIFAGSGAKAGYIGAGPYTLYVQVPRAAGQSVALAVDITDPLSRSTHALVAIDPYVPIPAPVVALSASRVAGVVGLTISTNVPDPPSPSQEWELRVGSHRLVTFPPTPPSSMVFAISSIPTIASAADMPNPALVPDNFAIRRIAGTGEVLLWGRSGYALAVAVTLTNPDALSATAQQVTS